MTYAPNLKYTSDEIKQQYRAWIVVNGFRDSIENVSAFLESAHQVLSLWKLRGDHNERFEIKASYWDEVVVNGVKQFHRLGFPDKLEHIRQEHDIALNDKFISQLISINVARNCLVHRHGIVSARDTTANNKLEVNWTKLQLVLKNEDGEKEYVLGEVAEKDSWIGIRSMNETKSFELGTSIEFSAKEFSDITWTSFLFGEDLVSKLNAYGLQRGFVAPAVDNA